MILVHAALFGMFLPALVCASILAVGWRPWRREGAAADGRWAGAVGFAGGYVVGHVGIVGWPAFPPVEATQWVVYLSLVAMAFGLLDARWRQGRWVRLVVVWSWRIALSVGVPWLLCRPFIGDAWGPTVGAIWLGGLALAVCSLWTSLDALADRVSGASLALALLAVAGGGAGVLLMSGSAMLAQLCGVLAAMLGVSLMVARWRSEVSLARGAVPVIVVVLTGLWMSGYFYAEMPAWSAILLVLASSAMWVGQWNFVRRLAGWQSALICLAVVLGPVVGALVIAQRSMPAEGFG